VLRRLPRIVETRSIQIATDADKVSANDAVGVRPGELYAQRVYAFVWGDEPPHGRQEGQASLAHYPLEGTMRV
jgi:hypothetical protein